MTNRDFVSDIVDEIALEGLDGITLEALWKRLLARPGFFLNPTDESVKKYIWNIISKLCCVSFYELPEARGDLFVFCRRDYVDNFGYFFEPELPPTIYPYVEIDENGIMGSCSTFHTRKDMTETVRCESFVQVSSRGNKLVIVADQDTRTRALMPSNINPVHDIKKHAYYVLERIGRARYEGEATNGIYGLFIVNSDPKMMYYYTKGLLKNKIVVKQNFYMKSQGKQACTCGSLLQLTRFHNEILSKPDTDVRVLIQYLLECPLQRASYRATSNQLNLELKKIILKYPRNFSTSLVPYRTLYPNAKASEWKMKASGEEKKVRLVELLSPELTKDDDEEEDDEDDSGVVDESQRRMDRSMIRQAYYHVERSGPRGIKQSTIAQLMGIPALQARCICKHLAKRNIIKTNFIDVGRQRILHFYCTKYESANTSIQLELEEEKSKLLQAIADNTSQVWNRVEKGEAKGNSGKETIKQEEPPKDEKEMIETEIIVSKPGPVNQGARASLDLTTARMLKRAKIVVEAINSLKVIQDTQKVQRIISEAEEAEGTKEVVDRRTVQNVLTKLESDGVLKRIQVNMRGYGREKTMLFICHPSITESHSEIQSAIEQAKMKLPVPSLHSTRKLLKKAQVEGKPKSCPYKFHAGKYGKRYGLKPKFVRLRIVHTFMYYLIYGYEGDSNLDQSIKEKMVKELKIDESVIDEMSFVYRAEVDWKMFLPPLPCHAEYSDGWCLLSDVLLRLPLCLFVSIVNIQYDIPQLIEYLDHPIRKFFLVKNLPTDMMHTLTSMRKYIFIISEIVSRLGFMGLIQMGPQKLKEKDQVFVYLNRNALLYNTIPSDVGYNHISADKTYECLKYHFNTMGDVDQYWYDLWNFALNTNLGNRHSMTGQPVVVESVNTKKELLPAIAPRSADEALANDVGYIPGDGLGAAGLDSDLFVHIRRNWYWTGDKSVGMPDEKSILGPPNVHQKTGRSRKSVAFAGPALGRKMRGIGECSDGSGRDKVGKQLGGQRKSRAISKKRTRIMSQRVNKYPRKPYYDQKDKDALSRMVKLRVDWSPTEDNLLLICKVASLYMCSDTRRYVAKNFAAIREVLHSTYPTISKNKTSRACQRRIHYMMKNPFTAESVYLCLEEVRRDPEVHEKFHSAVEELDAMLKAQGEGPKGCQEEYDKIFVSLVGTLLKKLKNITNHEHHLNINIPSTLAEFEKNFNFFAPTPEKTKNRTFTEVQKNMDIMAGVINTVIHSSLCCTSEKTSYSHQLFYVYEQYPDRLLRYVMSRCRSMQMISCRRRYKRWKSVGYNCLPLASSPYQLSISYVHLLQSKYQFIIFSESFSELKSILESKCPSEEIPDVNDNKKKERHIKNISIEVKCGGHCANIAELFSAELITLQVEFPEQVIVLDPRISETEESYKIIMKRFREILSVIKDSKSTKDKGLLSEGEEDDEDEEDNSTNNTNESYMEQFNLKNKTGVANTASRLALYLMRDEPGEQLDRSLQHAHDFFVLNPCKVTADVNKSRAEEMLFFNDLKNKVIAEIKKFGTFPMVKIENEDIIAQFKHLPKDLVLSVLNFIESKQELGATYEDLKEKFEVEEELSEVLTSLVNNQFILYTGVVAPRFIHNKHAKIWLVKSFAIMRLQRDALGGRHGNSAFAISIRSEGSMKRKLSDAESPKCKTARRDSCENVSNSREEEGSEEEETQVKKRQKTEESERKENEGDEESCTSTGSTSTRDNNDELPESVESEPHSRVIIRSTISKWVPAGNETFKKFSNFEPSESDNVYVRIRPWIKVDGSLNRRVLNRLLGSVLGHCLTWPGIPVVHLHDKFVPALQPAHVYELLEILQKIKCVKLIELKKSWKCSLFSKRVGISPEQSTDLGKITDVIVDPDPLAITRLGYFLGDKHYKTDYLTDLIHSNREATLDV